MDTRRNGPIVAVGDLVWDVLVKPDRLLLPGGDTTGRIAWAPGGSAANVAAWVARLAMPAAFVGKLGRDDFGDLIAKDLGDEGVELHLSRSESHSTGVILVLVDRAGQRSMVTNQGADFQLRPQDLPPGLLTNCAHVHITAWSLFSDPPRAAAIAAAQQAKVAGASVSFDPASHQMIREMGYDRFNRITSQLPVDLLFPNRDEGQALTGESDPEAIAEVLRARYKDAIIALKLDKEGCYVLANGEGQHYPTGDARALDATGAGDAFNAGFLAGFLREGNFEKAARLANLLGGWVVARHGARPPADDELREALRALGW